MDKPKKVKEYIAEKSSNNGNTHQIQGITKQGVINLWEEISKIQLQESDGVLTHEEHKEILFLEGVSYTQRKLVEFDLNEERSRDVID